MTVSEILSDAYRRTGFGASPDASVTTRLLAFANETHRELLSLPGLDALRDNQMTFASVANVSRVGLPPIVERITAIVDRTNRIVLQELTMAEVRRRNPGQVYTGIPTGFARVGFQEVATQPSAATGVWAVSSSAIDTAGPTVSINATRTNGYTHAPAATALTGTTRVQIGTNTDYLEIVRFSLSAACAGDVSLYDAAASGNLLAVIPVGQTYARYLAIQLDPVPATAQTYYLDFTRNIPDLATGTNEPLLPLDFHRLIGSGIRMREYEKTHNDLYEVAAAEYAAGKVALRSWAQNDGALLLSLRRGGSRIQRPSQLGAWYPAGT